MQKHSVNLAYLGPDGQPVLSTAYRFEGTEREVVDLRREIASETPLGSIHAGVLALAAQPRPNAEFVEFLTGGTLTLDETNSLTGDPAVLMWLDSVRRTGRAW